MTNSDRAIRNRRRTRIGCAAVLVVAAIGAILMALSFREDLGAANARITGRGTMIATRAGSLEYAEAGRGPPLLMIHGTGGGFDQGLMFSRGLSAAGVRVIAPSRFGYLRSSWPPDPSSERQADAFVDLLDHLRLDKVAVAGGSAGALSAVQFALRHPDRTSALILIVPAANVEGHDPNAMSPAQEWLVRRLMTSDFLYWVARKTMARRLVGFLLATDPALVDKAAPEERRRAYAILDQILPISRRWRGMLDDARLAGHPARVDFARLRVPLLLLSADDDRFGTAATARAIARRVPGSRLVIYPTGGHIFIGRQRASAAEIRSFIAKHHGAAASR